MKTRSWGTEDWYCENCIFSQRWPLRDGENNSPLICRRYPPPCPRVWSQLDWCGEFKQDKDKR